MRGLEAETSLISSGSAATHKRPITGLGWDKEDVFEKPLRWRAMGSFDEVLDVIGRPMQAQ